LKIISRFPWSVCVWWLSYLDCRFGRSSNPTCACLAHHLIGSSKVCRSSLGEWGRWIDIERWGVTQTFEGQNFIKESIWTCSWRDCPRRRREKF